MQDDKNMDHGTLNAKLGIENAKLKEAPGLRTEIGRDQSAEI